MLIALDIIMVSWVTHLLQTLRSGGRGGDEGNQRSRKCSRSALENKLHVLVTQHLTLSQITGRSWQFAWSILMCFAVFEETHERVPRHLLEGVVFVLPLL